MRKIVPLLLMALCAQIAMAATDLTGHFHIDLSALQIPVGSAEQYFSTYLDLPAGTDLVLRRDTVDKMGYRHLTYQQYVDEVAVKGAKVLIHAYNGLVRTMNGEVRTRTQQLALDTVSSGISARQALRRVGRHSAPETEANKVWVKVLSGEQYVYHLTYEVRSADWTRLQYVDVYTGEVVTETSLVYHADVQGTAYTMYNGVQPFTCHQHADGLYYLEDSARHLITYDASRATPIDYSNIEYQYELDDAVEAYRLSCSPITCTSSTWDWQYHRYLKQVTITSLPVWTDLHGDTLPTLYLKIYNSQGTLLHETDTMALDSLPATFSIPDGVETMDGMLVFSLYHYDIEQDTSACITVFAGYQAHIIGRYPISVPDVLEARIRFEDTSLRPALDVHWGMQKAIDFYREVFGRNGFDDHGTVIYQYYNPHPDILLFDGMPLNASAIPYTNPNIMVYGSGALKYGDSIGAMNPVVGFDIMAHEFSHLVTTHNGNGSLTYMYESGALNESFSDLMAMGVVNYVFDTCSWTIGADVMSFVSNMRSLSDPHLSKDGLDPNPKYYQGEYWDASDDDNGGVHTNSSVQNYWFYLLCEGGLGTNEAGESFDITGIGIDKGVQIAYLNLLYYLTPNAAYADARWGSEQAAIELYGIHSEEYNAVVAAWDAVGVDATPDAPAALDAAGANAPVSKVLRHGQLLILRDGEVYDIMGRRVNR